MVVIFGIPFNLVLPEGGAGGSNGNSASRQAGGSSSLSAGGRGLGVREITKEKVRTLFFGFA